MKRRSFLSKSLGASLFLSLPISLKSQSLYKKSISFGLVADAHQDLLHDVEARMERFIDSAKENTTDFIVQLGDFCFPKQQNKPFMKIWEDYNKPKYHILGNHDMDTSTKEETMDFWGMSENYYSFDQDGFHFVVLDANFINQKGKFTDYANANFYINGDLRTWINPEQLEWLEADLNQTTKPSIIFSHQSLASDLWGVKNRTKVQRILEKANQNPKAANVIACFNGHNHIDFCRKLNGIYYIDINSLSYQWLGKDYECTTRYAKEVYDQYPNLSKMATYEKALFTTVTISDNLLKLNGVSSKYVGPSPQELGLTETVYGVDFTAEITGRELKVDY